TTPSLSAFCPHFPYPTVWRKRTLSGHQAQIGPPPKKWGFLLTHFPFSCMPSELSCPPPPIPAERIPGEEDLDTHPLSLTLTPTSHRRIAPSSQPAAGVRTALVAIGGKGRDGPADRARRRGG
ncbi:uncharacterized protein BO88DRAFT_481633, partial [Aspergillus vadensis CBS 113365]